MTWQGVSAFRTGLGAAILALAMGTPPTHAAEVLRLPLVSDIGTLDPDNGFEIGAVSAINNLYEGLVEYAPGTTDIVGLLADRWTISDDGLTYTFHLIDGVKFHDGTPLDAQAVVSSFSRRIEHEYLLSYFFANVASITAPDSNTVVFALKQPQQSLLDGLASPYGPKVISPKALAEHDSNGDGATGWLTDHADGTGPFKLAEFKRGEVYVFERNEDYWGDKPFFDEIQLPVVPDISVQILQLQAGEIDAVPVDYPFAQLASLPEGLEVTSGPSVNQYDLFFKAGTVLDDKEVRNAVLAAINPALWANDVFFGHGPLAKSVFPEVVLNPARPVQYPADLEAAKAAVARHGDVQFTIGTFSETPTYRRIAELMIAELTKIGVKATAYALPANYAFAMRGDAKAPDVFLTIAGPDAAHPDNQLIYYLSDGAVNWFGRSLPEADALVKKAGALRDATASDVLYQQASQLWVDAGFVAPLVDVDDVVVHARGLTDLGLRPVFPFGNIDFGSVRWTK
jgi:peptide/nickel transport system substrate-binding protein